MTPKELRDRRRRLGWTQASAADHFGMSHRGYRYLEQGETSAGKAAPQVPRPVAISMIALELARDIEVAALTPEKLALFCRAVQRETFVPHVRQPEPEAATGTYE
jgi:transcriptional regulator with XRE-family HTH domain